MARASSTSSRRSTVLLAVGAILLLLWIEGVQIFGLIAALAELGLMVLAFILLAVVARKVMRPLSRR